MDEALRHYLETHRRSVNAAAVQIACGLADPNDTDRDARRLLRDAREALHKAIEAALDKGPVEGWRLGSVGEVCVVVRVPRGGQGSLGKIGISSARLDMSGMIPCPDEWPQDYAPLAGSVDHLHRMIFPPSNGPRIVEADKEGRVPLGPGRADATYLVEELADGEVWLRPLGPIETSGIQGNQA